MNNQKTLFSFELQVLIEAIRLILLNKQKDTFSALINSSDIDWERLTQMAVYHRIRPLLYEACRIVGFENKSVAVLKKFVRNQAMNDLSSIQELGNILAFFQENDIECIPYKGILFSEKLYGKKPYRESCDIDILVKPEKASKAAKLLLENGYNLTTKHTEIHKIDDDFIDDLIKRAQNGELGLYKESPMGIKLYIDFHWAIGENFHFYTIDLNEFFEQTEIENFQRKLVRIPNAKAIFKMMLNHHGGRGCWLRLKDFADLIAFRNRYPEHDSSCLRNWAEEMKMKKIFDTGNAIMENIFSESGESIVFEQKIGHRIFSFWEKSRHYDRFLPKIKYKSIYRQLQDTPLSWAEYTHQLIKFYSLPNALERKRLMVFPDRFTYLNALSKLISYLWYRVKIKKIV
ncbi:nucleotidyltransferase family protein [Emticicia fontis]